MNDVMKEKHICSPSNTGTGWDTPKLRSGSVEIIAEDLSDKKNKNKRAQKSGSIGLLSLSVLVFYGVNGGAFGIEDIVAAGGPFFALTG